MMNQDRKLDLLSAYVDGELPASERGELEALLAADSELRRAHDELLRIRRGMASLESLRAKPDFAARVMQQITAESPALSASPARSEFGRATRPAAKSTRSSAGWLAASSWRLAAAMAVAAAAILAIMLWGPAWNRTAPRNSMPVAKEKATPALTREVASDQIVPPGVAGPAGIGPEETLVQQADPEHAFATGQKPAGMQIMSVFDVLIAESAYKQGLFAEVLHSANVKLEQGVKVDEDLEKAIFGTRLLGRLEDPAGDQDKTAHPADGLPLTPPLKKVDMVYVVATGPQIDRIYQRLQELSPRQIRGVRMDLALTKEDQALFQQLHRASDLLLVQGEGAVGIARRVVLGLALESRMMRRLALAGGGIAALGMVGIDSPTGQSVPNSAAVAPPAKADSPDLELARQALEELAQQPAVPLGDGAGQAGLNQGPAAQESFQAIFLLRIVPDAK